VASLALVKHVVRDDPIPLVGCEKNHFNEKLTIHPDARERSFPGCRLLAAASEPADANAGVRAGR
jgi:hypothetical protein